jgi:hypothetical protein
MHNKQDTHQDSPIKSNLEESKLKGELDLSELAATGLGAGRKAPRKTSLME